jgi:hypothetical protein
MTSETEVDHNESFENISKLKYLGILTITNENKKGELEDKMNMQGMIIRVSIISAGGSGIVSNGVCGGVLLDFITKGMGWLVCWRNVSVM